MTRESFWARWSRMKLDRSPPAQRPTAEPAVNADAENDGSSADTLPSVAELRQLWREDPALAAPDRLDLHNVDYPLPNSDEPVASAWLADHPLTEEPPADSDADTAATVTDEKASS